MRVIRQRETPSVPDKIQVADDGAPMFLPFLGQNLCAWVIAFLDSLHKSMKPSELRLRVSVSFFGTIFTHIASDAIGGLLECRHENENIY